MQARGLGKKAVLIDISRGGLYAYRWAAEYPEKVAVIYGDAAVCDFKSCPGGKARAREPRQLEARRSFTVSTMKPRRWPIAAIRSTCWHLWRKRKSR